MSSQPGEAEGRAGDDAEPAERRAEVCLASLASCPHPSPFSFTLSAISPGVCRSTTPGETKLLASEIYELLQASSSAEAAPAEGAVSGRRKAQFFLGSSNKRAKTVVLHIDGLDDSVSPVTLAQLAGSQTTESVKQPLNTPPSSKLLLFMIQRNRE